MGRPNYSYAKRQKEIAKKQKKEAKRLKRLEKKADKAAAETGDVPPEASADAERPLPAADQPEAGDLPAADNR